MSAVSPTELYKEIKAHIDTFDFPYNKWQVGLAKNVEFTLFTEHKVDRYNDSWVYRIYDNLSDAKSAKNDFIQLGLQSVEDSGNECPLFLFAFIKT